MSSRRPSASRGPSRPGAPRRTLTGGRSQQQSSTEDVPRLKSKQRVKRSIVVGSEGGKVRALSMRLVTVILVGLLAIIIVTPTLSNYLDQQQELRELNRSVEEAQARISSLENELRLWNDDEYVRAQARERLGYVKPGEVLYTVEDPTEGTAEEQREALATELEYNRRAATPWFTTMWDSVTIAGYSSEGDDVVDPTDPSTTPDVGENE